MHFSGYRLGKIRTCTFHAIDLVNSDMHFSSYRLDTFQAIDSVKQPSDHKVVDLFILLILYSTDRKKPVESLIRNKIRSGAFTEVLLQEAFTERAQVSSDSLIYFFDQIS